MKKKLLLLGHTGKMGLAIHRELASDYEVVGKNSQTLDATDLQAVQQCIETEKPAVVVNTIAFMGLDACEKHPQQALQLNTLLPKRLAELSLTHQFTLVHCSTEAVFGDRQDLDNPYAESDAPNPINMYGYTKLGADYFIGSIAKDYYICRLPILFGESIKNNQFVEKMLQRVANGQEVLRIAHDIYSCPTYSKDIAIEIKKILAQKLPAGLYHINNQGTATLYELMVELKNILQFSTRVEPASCMDFPSIGTKNLRTPMHSEKLTPLRSWQAALAEYCQNMPTPAS